MASPFPAIPTRGATNRSVLETLRYFYRYNDWAMEKVLLALEKIRPNDWDAQGCSGHGSIRRTLAHLFNTQAGWFAWFDGTLDVASALKPLYAPDEITDATNARDKWAPISRRTSTLLARLTESEIQKEWSWSVPNVNTGSAILWHMMLHVANHGTHTRAQIVAAIRRLGYEPGVVEMMAYLMSPAGRE